VRTESHLPACWGYTDCGVVLKNDTTDPDLPPTAQDWLTFTWDILETSTSPDDTCGPTQNPSDCNFTPANYIPDPPPQGTVTYHIILTATDLAGNVSSTTIEYLHRRGAIADFECSLDNESWDIGCENADVERKQTIYLKDNLSSSYRHSIPSAGADNIVQRVWKMLVGGEVVDEFGGNSPTATHSITMVNSSIRLEATDNNADGGGRTDIIDHGVPMVFSPPEWREIPL